MGTKQTANFRILFEKALSCLRTKIPTSESAVATISDIISQIPAQDAKDFRFFEDPKFLRDFHATTKVN